MEAGFDYNEFTAKFHKHFKPNDINLKDLCITRSVMNLSDFYKTMQQQMQEEAAQTTPTKQLGTVAEYTELFKVLDTYPSNLQRATSKKRELQRTNSSTLKVNEDQSSINNNSSVALSSTTLNTTRPDDGRKAAEVYSDFKKFQQKLRAVREEGAALNKAQDAYSTSITQLQQFAQQLEKLLPSCEREAPLAFTDSEEASLNNIAENLKQLNFMRSESVVQLGSCNYETSLARLEALVEVLSYTLMQLTEAL